MKQRHLLLGLLVALAIITYMDRICISVAGHRMQEDLGISDSRWGWVLAVFMISYGVFEIPSGAMGDCWGQRRVLTRIVVWWSAFTCLTGLASNYVVLLITRFLFGAGEAGAFPNMAGSVSRWFPATERARAQGFIWGASRLGGALSPVLVVPIMVGLGWRTAFFFFGAIGMAWAVIWYWWYRDQPHGHPAVPPEELAEIGPPPPPTHQGVPWRQLFGSRQLWLIMLMYWCYVWGSMFYLSWFPTYLVKGRGLSEKESVFAALAFVMGMIGNLTGGFLCDFLARRLGLSLGRRLIGSVSLAGSALLLLATALTTGKATGVILLALGFGLMDCMLPAAWAMCLDVGGKYAGAVTGAMNSAGQAGGFICTVLFGYLVEAYGYHVPLFPIAAMVMTAALLFWLIDPATPLVPAEIPAPNEEPVCV